MIRLNLLHGFWPIGYGIASLYPNTYSNVVLKTVCQILELCIDKLSTTEYVKETPELYLTFNISIFNNKNYWQTVGTVYRLYISCFHHDLSLATYEKKLAFNCSPRTLMVS